MKLSLAVIVLLGLLVLPCTSAYQDELEEVNRHLKPFGFNSAIFVPINKLLFRTNDFLKIDVHVHFRYLPHFE